MDDIELIELLREKGIGCGLGDVKCQFGQLKTLIEELCNDRLRLIDGAYEIVELYKPQSPAQEEWRKRWLEDARSLGAVPM